MIVDHRAAWESTKPLLSRRALGLDRAWNPSKAIYSTVDPQVPSPTPLSLETALLFPRPKTGGPRAGNGECLAHLRTKRVCMFGMVKTQSSSSRGPPDLPGQAGAACSAAVRKTVLVGGWPAQDIKLKNTDLGGSIINDPARFISPIFIEGLLCVRHFSKSKRFHRKKKKKEVLALVEAALERSERNDTKSQWVKGVPWVWWL